MYDFFCCARTFDPFDSNRSVHRSIDNIWCVVTIYFVRLYKDFLVRSEFYIRDFKGQVRKQMMKLRGMLDIVIEKQFFERPAHLSPRV
jgi:hypothetical protein